MELTEIQDLVRTVEPVNHKMIFTEIKSMEYKMQCKTFMISFSFVHYNVKTQIEKQFIYIIFLMPVSKVNVTIVGTASF